jgi:hypothetical protein
MDIQLVIERFQRLPEEMQWEVYDFIETLLNPNPPISEDLKKLLDERIANFEKNPQNVFTWEEVKAKFNKKYGYKI